jgi:hypothetical protein
LALQLFDETSERVSGLKVKRLGGDESVLPEALARGIVGCGKDSRRLILAPVTESEFVLYDVTILRTRKPSLKDGTEAAGADARSERVDDERVTDAIAVGEQTAPLARPSAADLTPQTPQAPQAAARVTPNATQLVGTPPPPQWWMYNQHAPMSMHQYGTPQMPAALSTPDQTLISDVRRAVASLAEDVASLAVKTRRGGAWIPPTPEGEFKHAIEALHKARRVVMLPTIGVETLSIGDVKQLTVEAERLAELQEELREARRTES